VLFRSLSEFETLKKSLQSVIERKGEMQAEQRKGLERWSEIMAGHLDGINRDFNEILGEIGARGRVSLTDGDVRNVGLDIEVGFAGKEFTSISTLSQSGGEKSLSTMSFLLALQRQIKSPFRAVDEYDVHLDPMNKDLVTRLLKSAVRRDGAKQYIAITPSQIPRHDLEGAENVVVVQSVEGRSRVGSLVLEASG
jgi:chromosome segregation protein